MQIDFHYYATYCAAYLAGYSHEESLSICRSSQFTDCCSATLLSGVGAPLSAATTQLHLEMMNAKTEVNKNWLNTRAASVMPSRRISLTKTGRKPYRTLALTTARTPFFLLVEKLIRRDYIIRKRAAANIIKHIIIYFRDYDKRSFRV